MLRALAAALPGNLELHEADLLKEGSFDNVVKGADLLFHTASPFFTGATDDPQRDLVLVVLYCKNVAAMSTPHRLIPESVAFCLLEVLLKPECAAFPTTLSKAGSGLAFQHSDLLLQTGGPSTERDSQRSMLGG